MSARVSMASTETALPLPSSSSNVPLDDLTAKCAKDHEAFHDDLSDKIKLRISETGQVERCSFSYLQGNAYFQFHVSVKKAGSVDEALRIAGICYQQFESGHTKEWVLHCRNQLLARNPLGRASQMQRPEEGEVFPVFDVVEGLADYAEKDSSGKDSGASSSRFAGRFGLPPDSPLRPSARAEYIFVARMPGRHERFTRVPSRAAILRDWCYEILCDLWAQMLFRAVFAALLPKTCIR